MSALQGGALRVLIEYRAETLLDQWTELEERSEKVYRKLDKATGIAYFELIHAVVRLMTNLNRLYVAGEFFMLGGYSIGSMNADHSSRQKQHVCGSIPDFYQLLGGRIDRAFQKRSEYHAGVS